MSKKHQIQHLFREVERLQGLINASTADSRTQLIEKNQGKIVDGVAEVSRQLAAFGNEFLRLDWKIEPMNGGLFYVSVRKVGHDDLRHCKIKVEKPVGSLSASQYWQDVRSCEGGDTYAVYDVPSNKLNVQVDGNGYLQAVLEETEALADPNLKEAWGETVAEAQDLVLDLIDEFVRDFTFGPESDEVARLSGTVVL